LLTGSKRKGEGITAAQAAIAWVASRRADIIPVVGARTVERLTEALASPLELSKEALSEIEKAVPEEAVGGNRFMVAH
jgi:aryl-alcohol dehydrogenase-like predicted oxidoreductase